MKTLLSLFDYSLNWARPYYENGWAVCQLDIKHGNDINEIDAEWVWENIFDNSPTGTVDGIIAAPPCTDFAVSGAQYWPRKDEDGSTEAAVELIYQVLRIVDLCQPDFWALENPVGRLNKLVPELAEYGPWYFQPHWYGDAYTKKTGLWGEFNKPTKTNAVGLFQEVEATPYDEVEPERACAQGSWLQKLGGKSERTKELRSMTPEGFAYAFWEANH
ncbi:DNA cytosine methyltransferase [Phaeodactylibacter xiamenensis]|uniref:DNA cytosine methyltransferase n=1 Tax=Phaeodactylibacter xiamenensis TaxID=1524460 RepID=UPI0024A88D2F|nr:DNA cytosine methyltransferase [Phaeodactylibacter xiamenensis]